jgi:hypothetical protein
MPGSEADRRSRPNATGRMSGSAYSRRKTAKPSCICTKSRAERPGVREAPDPPSYRLSQANLRSLFSKRLEVPSCRTRPHWRSSRPGRTRTQRVSSNAPRSRWIIRRFGRWRTSPASQFWSETNSGAGRDGLSSGVAVLVGTGRAAVALDGGWVCTFVRSSSALRVREIASCRRRRLLRLEWCCASG